MRILVCIASYGSRNDGYLRQLLAEYARMPYAVDVVVLSNVEKELPSGVELRVGLPTKNPWSLPFAHRQVFIDRQNDYDLFIYSEDDTLITARHVDAFTRSTQTLAKDEIAGYLRSEEGPDETLYYSTVHRHFHWDPSSVVVRGGETYAFFTNEHGACYILTREQLHAAIASGGLGVEPHEGKYDMLVSAATDPYTRCGFKKLICVSRLADFTCKHLTNKYVGRTGLESSLVDVQVSALLEIGRGASVQPVSVRVESFLPGQRWAKSYYEPARDDLLARLPQETRRVLSIGCGWGRTEQALCAKGVDVTAIPLDAVIARVAADKGVRVVPVSLAEGAHALREEQFDALLISNLLHLVADPVSLLRSYGSLLVAGGNLVISVPNIAHLGVRLKRLARSPDVRALGDFGESGVHPTSISLVKSWLASAGFDIQNSSATVAPKWQAADRVTLGLTKGLWAEELILVARKRPVAQTSIARASAPEPRKEAVRRDVAPAD